MGTVRRGGCRWNEKGDEERSIFPQSGKEAEEPSFVDSIGNRIGLESLASVANRSYKMATLAGFEPAVIR